MKQFKSTIFDWHLIGFFTIVFSVICYLYKFFRSFSFWEFLWVCPVVAIIAGIFILLRNRFGISASIVWISIGPLLAVLFNPTLCYQLWYSHHLLSLIALVLILWHIKEVWDAKGFLFGLTSFYTYILITSGLSRGKINVLTWQFVSYKMSFLLGIFFLILSLGILLWHFSEKYKKIK
jgi:hypothetical protein